LTGDPKTDFGVIVPDLAGCFSAGNSFENAIDNAKEAVECHIEGMLKDNDPIPIVFDSTVLESAPEEIVPVNVDGNQKFFYSSSLTCLDDVVFFCRLVDNYL